MFPGRVQHEEKLHGQGHLRPVRATVSSVNNASSIQSSLFHGFCIYWSPLSPFSPHRLFEWLVTFINNSICADKSAWINFIGKGIFTGMSVGGFALF